METNQLVQEVRTIAKKAGVSKFRIRMVKGKLKVEIKLRIKADKWPLVQADVFLLTRHNEVTIHYDVKSEILTVTKNPVNDEGVPSSDSI